MGCDIHLHIEIKVAGHWHHYNHPGVPRNYELFSLMGGVRNPLPDQEGYIEPVASFRGIPDDVTFTTKLDYVHWGMDAHSASYLLTDEVIKVCKWLVKNEPKRFLAPSEYFCFLFGNRFNSFREYRSEYPKEIEEFRFVFWFDN
jgi:hypothetical protein